MKKNQGFSLIELSVVLAIMGLLLAGVLQGVTLVEVAKIRSLSTEIEKHKVSFVNFKTKYNKNPGDFDKATDFWGASNTSDGDGDGEIDFFESAVYEGYRAWQHLSFSRIISTVFEGDETTSTPEYDVDIPSSSYSGGYAVESNIVGIDNVALILGRPQASSTTILMNSIISPENANLLDLKFDDSRPNNGKVRAIEGEEASASSCVASDAYVITNSNKNCILAFDLFKI